MHLGMWSLLFMAATTAVLWPTDCTFGEAPQEIVDTAQKRDHSPQATSAHKVMNAPVSRIDLTQAKPQAGSEAGRLFVNGARFHI